MKAIAFVLGGAVLSTAIGLAAQQQDGERKDMKPAKPGPEHQVLRQFEGQWDADIRHCARHGASESAKGSETSAFRLGGFWLMSEFKSTMKDQPFQGHGMLGYDQGRKRYVMTWTSSMSSNLTLFEGDYDATGKTLTLTADCVAPDGKPMKLQAVHRVVDPDHTEFQLIGLGMESEGKDCPCMTIQYTRRR